MNLGFEPDGDGAGGARRQGDRFWTQGHRLAARRAGIASSRTTWPASGAQEPVSARVRVSSGVDWLNLDMIVRGRRRRRSDEEELRMCLGQGKKLVRLEDGTYAPVKADEVGAGARAHGRDLRRRGRRQARAARRRPDACRSCCASCPTRTCRARAKSCSASSRTSARSRASPSRARCRPRCAPTRKTASRGSCSCTSWARAASSPTTWVSVRRCRRSRCCCGLKAKSKGRKPSHLVVAPTSVRANWQREIEKFAPGFKTRVAGTAPTARSAPRSSKTPTW